MKPLAQQNLYEVLEVPFDATVSAISEAVERAQALYAPGSLATYTLMDPEEEQLLGRLLDEARATLLDPEARARYDERITGPDQQAPPKLSQAAPTELDAAIRAVWPELPPVIPAARPPFDEDFEEELPSAPLAPAPVLPAVQAASAAVVAAPPTVEATASSRRPARILLSREVAPAPSIPPPAPAPAAAQAPPAHTPAPLATPVPMAPPPPSAPLVADTTTWSGEVLRRLREARGLSVQQVSERTKVTRHHIENIEADRYDQLPASVYLRGILLSMARELRLDGPKVARSYLERAAQAGPPAGPPGRGR